MSLLAGVKRLLAQQAEPPAQTNARILNTVGIDTTLTPKRKKKGMTTTVLPDTLPQEDKNVLG